jgi:hypothetical protein
MPGTERRRAVLEAILNDPKSSTADVLRACELAERLDTRPELDVETAYLVEFAQSLQGMTPEQLAREVAALSKPVTSGLSVEHDDAVRRAVERELEPRVRELTKEHLAEIRRLREALARAESLRGVPDLAERRKAASEAPSASQTAPEDDRPVKVVEIPEALRRTAATASKPVSDRVRTSFERKLRGET